MTREERWAQKVMREGERARNYGMRTRPARCGSCNKFKSRPSSVCGSCGDDPVGNTQSPEFADRLNYDRAHGYA